MKQIIDKLDFIKINYYSAKVNVKREDKPHIGVMACKRIILQLKIILKDTTDERLVCKI